jgi:hypothetical protein
MLLILAALAVSSAACDRNLEPFDPAERPERPDLSRIFPEGAERTAQLDSPAGMPNPRGGRGAAPLGSGPPVRGTVRLAPELEGRVPPRGVLFLIARTPGGGPPLAVKRITDLRFPMEFELGPEDRMVDQIPFAGQLSISARVDSDGNATTRLPGDMQGAAAAPVQPGESGVEIVIDEVQGASL